MGVLGCGFKVIVTTSDKYHHLLPIFCFLFNKYWGADQEVEIVGYKVPNVKLPENFTFVSLGEQPTRRDQWSTTLRKHFLKQPDYFIWSMEDTFIKDFVNHKSLSILHEIVQDKFVGRVALSDYSFSQYEHPYKIIDGCKISNTSTLSKYNLSTQVALWNKDYLLRYMFNNLDPWQFECQRKHVDCFKNVSFEPKHAPIKHNEGVRISDIFKLNLNGISKRMILEMNQKLIL